MYDSLLIKKPTLLEHGDEIYYYKEKKEYKHINFRSTVIKYLLYIRILCYIMVDFAQTIYKNYK